jgi:hypothetical protein
VQEKFDSTIGVIKTHNSKKDKLYNSQRKENKKTNNDHQNITR